MSTYVLSFHLCSLKIKQMDIILHTFIKYRQILYVNAHGVCLSVSPPVCALDNLRKDWAIDFKLAMWVS